MKFKLFAMLIISLLFADLANAAVGVGYPFPSQLELRPGESGRFQFEIQTTPEEGLVTCNYNLENPIPITIEFDEQTTSIPQTGQMIRMPVYATVTAPIETEPGKYSTSFCVTCAPAESGNPVGMLGAYCGITFGVDVVGERTRENPYVPPKPAKINGLILAIIIAGIGILILLAVLITRRILKKR